MVYEIKEIKYSDTKDFILKKHYAQRMPSVSFAYGLFDSSDMLLNEETHLTESEIKQDFEWAWQWAKEVDND